MQAFTKVIIGILQPTVGHPNYKYKLITDDSYFHLDAPKDLMDLLERHTWERIVVKGYLKEPNVFCVKSARLENNDTLSLHDFTKHFDMEAIRRTINRGFIIEPTMPEIVY